MYQDIFTCLIKAGIRLVHDHIFGIAIQRPGNRQALLLTARQHKPCLADQGVITVRKRQYGFVHTDQPRGLDNLFRIHRVQARNVFRNGPIKEFNFLRDIADILTNLIMVPFAQLDAV